MKWNYYENIIIISSEIENATEMEPFHRSTPEKEKHLNGPRGFPEKLSRYYYLETAYLKIHKERAPPLGHQ